MPDNNGVTPFAEPYRKSESLEASLLRDLNNTLVLAKLDEIYVATLSSQDYLSLISGFLENIVESNVMLTSRTILPSSSLSIYIDQATATQKSIYDAIIADAMLQANVVRVTSAEVVPCKAPHPTTSLLVSGWGWKITYETNSHDVGQNEVPPSGSSGGNSPR
jgi:hypothetical protein